MTIEAQFGDNNNDVDFGQYDLSFVGDTIDERGRKSKEFLTLRSARIIYISYLPSDFKIIVNENKYDVEDLSDKITVNDNDKIIIDATTVGFVELLLLCQYFVDTGIKNFSIMYLEPLSYNKRSVENLLQYRDFDLSIQTLGYEAIPGHALSINNDYYQKVVFLCGFEAERMDRVIEDSEIINDQCKCIFGLPAYSPGWEMNSFANYISIMESKGLKRDIDFCGATSPLSTFNKLNKVFNGLDDNSQMFVVPLATKPMSIGACLFLATTPKDKVAVLYDHPQKKLGRGIQVGKWHLFNITN